MLPGLDLDFTDEVNKLRAVLFCQLCNGKKAQRWSCRHTSCVACDEGAPACPVCAGATPHEADSGDEELFETLSAVVACFTSQASNRSPRNVLLGHEVITVARIKCNRKGESPLHVACKTRRLDSVEQCISEGHSLNFKDYAGWTPLHEAVESNFCAGVEALLRAGALCDVPGDLYATPLHRAVVKSNFCDNQEVVRLLRRYGADLNAADYHGETPLSLSNARVLSILSESDMKIERARRPLFIDRVVVYAKSLPSAVKDGLVKIATLVKAVDSETTHVIIEDEESQRFTALTGKLVGAFVTDVNWLDEFIGSDGKAVVPAGDASGRHVLDRLSGKPPLFHGVNFYIAGHGKEVTLEDGAVVAPIAKNDLINLIKLGGGQMLSRCPTVSTARGDCFPYHAPRGPQQKACSNYVIYDEGDPPELCYNMAELKHKGTKWLLECVSAYAILS